MGGVRLVFGVGQDLHDLTQGRDVPEPGAVAHLGGRPGQDGLGFLLPGAGEFRRALVPGVPGRDRAHPRGPPLGQPFLHRPLRPLDRLCDGARIDATGGVQDRLGLHPGEHATAGAASSTRPGRRSPSGATPTRTPPHRIRNSTGNPRKTRFRFMSAVGVSLGLRQDFCISPQEF